MEKKSFWSNLKNQRRILVVFAGLLVVCLLGFALFAAFNFGQSSGAPAITAANLPLAKPTAAPFSFASAVTPAATKNSVQQTTNAAATSAPAASTVAVNDPARFLDLANGFLTNGQYVAASAEYRLILQNYPKSSQVPAAMFGLGRSLQARNDLAAATQTLQQFLTTYPNDSHKYEAVLIMADLAKAQGKWNDAINYYQQYQQHSHLLDGYIYYNLGQIYDSLLQPAQAVQAYQQSANSSNGSLLQRVTSMEYLGDYYSKAKDYTNAANWYKQIINLSQLASYKASIMWKLIGVYNSANQPNQVAPLYSQLVQQYLDTAAGQQAFNTLLNNNPNALDAYERGYTDWLNDNYVDAVTEFNSYLGRSDQNAAVPIPANLDSAATAKRVSAWFYMAASYVEKGDLPKGITEYENLQAAYPKSSLAPEALFDSAINFEQANATKQAITQYAKVVSTYPNSSFATQSLVSEARLLEQQSGPDAARPIVNTLMAQYPASGERDQALYELAQAYKAKGDSTTGQQMLNLAAQGVAGDYYAMRATDLLNNQSSDHPITSNPLSQPAVYDSSRFAEDISSERPQFEDWLLHWAVQPAKNANQTATPASAQTQLVTAQQTVNNDPAVQRMIELWQVGWSDQADREAQEITDKYQGQPLELYYLALTLNQYQQYYFSIEAAKDLLSLAQAQNPSLGLRNVPIFLQKLIFPLDYQDIVLENSKTNNLDPLLLLSLIKQESAFRATATSGSKAMGLTQIIPSTASAIAANLGQTNFSTDELYQPYTAIQFGAYYLANRIQDYDGEIFEAIAAYNGGEGNVNQWVADHPPSKNLDDFVENISFSETRNYVKIVYANYAMYRQLYSAKTTN